MESDCFYLLPNVMTKCLTETIFGRVMTHQGWSIMATRVFRYWYCSHSIHSHDVDAQFALLLISNLVLKHMKYHCPMGYSAKSHLSLGIFSQKDFPSSQKICLLVCSNFWQDSNHCNQHRVLRNDIISLAILSGLWCHLHQGTLTTVWSNEISSMMSHQNSRLKM